MSQYCRGLLCDCITSRRFVWKSRGPPLGSGRNQELGQTWNDKPRYNASTNNKWYITYSHIGGGTTLYTCICIKRSDLQIIDKWDLISPSSIQIIYWWRWWWCLSPGGPWSPVTSPGPGQHSRLLFRCILSPELLRTLNQYGNQNIGSENTYFLGPLKSWHWHKSVTEWEIKLAR